MKVGELLAELESIRETLFPAQPVKGLDDRVCEAGDELLALADKIRDEGITN